MMIFDALISNTDRHFGNFGLLVDKETNKPIAFAPIFDNWMSLFNYAIEDDLCEIEKYAKTRTPAFEGVSLRKLINFKFKKHSKYNLPNDRLKNIEAFIQTRVQEMLNMKK